MSTRIKVVGFVDIGGREKNDDRILLHKSVYDEGIHEAILEMPCSLAVCDGVGGAPRGDSAAEFVLNKIKEKDIADLNDEKQMSDFLSEINMKLLLEQDSNYMVNAMKTTIVGINFFLDRVIYYNSGDSRLYRYRNNILRKLSEDHNITQEMLDKGIYIENYEIELMNCNRITRCLGAVNVLPPYIHKINNNVYIKDIYLLCSDGLWSVVTDAEIEEILGKAFSLKEKVQKLYYLAKEKKNQDNISIIIAEIED